MDRTRLLGLLIVIVTTSWIIAPEGLGMQQLKIGLGISHRNPEITAYPNRVNGFEVGRMYNTGDEVITIKAVWRPLTETTDVSVDLFPSERTVQPDESYIITATAATTDQLGSVEGVVEIITIAGIATPEAFVGGVVLPGAELPFTINVVKPPVEPVSYDIPEETVGAIVGYGLGGLLIVMPEAMEAIFQKLGGA